MATKNEIDALVSLLDDPDEIIFNQIKSQLLELGTDCIPHLEKANFENGEVQRFVNLEDLEKCCKMSIWLQKSASIQPRTSLPKFQE